MTQRRPARLVAAGGPAGPGLDAGEFFGILRLPCTAQAESLWDSPACRELVKLRAGRMTAEALLFE